MELTNYYSQQSCLGLTQEWFISEYFLVYNYIAMNIWAADVQKKSF